MRDKQPPEDSGIRGGPSGPPSGHPPVLPPVLTALGATRAALADVAADRCWSLSDADVEVALGGVVAARAQLDELALRLLSAAGQRGLGGAVGSASLASWWAARSGRTRGAAGADVRLADSLDRGLDRSPDGTGLEATRAALAAGALSVEQVAVIDRALGALPDQVTAAQRSDAEVFLVEQAAGIEGSDRLAACVRAGKVVPEVVSGGPLGLGPKELTRLGRRLFDVIDPEAADEHEGLLLAAEEARARRLTWLRMRPVGDGTTRGSFRLPDARADMLRTVLEGYASPRRHPSAGGTSAAGTGGTNAGGAGDSGDAGGAGRRVFAADLDPGLTHSDVHAAGLGNGAMRAGEGDTTPTTLGYGQRLGLALCELLEHVPLDKLPQAGGVAATITVFLDHARLVDGVGAATLSTGTKISAAQARRLACGAGLLPLVFGGDSMVLDAGREQRLYDRYGRVALSAHDQGCVFPGCDRPPAWCEAHHLTPWLRGGRTDVSDGCLLCPFHHHLIHAGEWDARMGPHGIPEIIPPARVDPTRTPRRHERFEPRVLTPGRR